MFSLRGWLLLPSRLCRAAHSQMTPLEEATPSDTDLVCIESPTYPLLKVRDITAIGERARRAPKG